MNTIARRRKELGLNQSRLGALVGQDQARVSEWERGVRDPRKASAYTFRALARALGMGMDELYDELDAGEDTRSARHK